MKKPQTMQMRLSVKDAKAFVKALINPPKPTSALRDAAKAHRKMLNARR